MEWTCKCAGLRKLAHPFKELNNTNELEKLVDLGIQGIENQPNFQKQCHN
jgi:hypothetical protein